MITLKSVSPDEVSPPGPLGRRHRLEPLGEALEGGDRLGGLVRLVGRADLERGVGQLTRSSSSSRGMRWRTC